MIHLEYDKQLQRGQGNRALIYDPLLSPLDYCKLLNPGLLWTFQVKSGTICKGVRWAGCYSGPELRAEVLETDWIQRQEVEALIHCVDSG